MLTADDLTAAEQQVVRAVARGQAVDLRVGDAAADEPSRGASWPPERTIRADLVARLLMDTDARSPVRLAGARIAGSLDLEGVTLGRWLLLTDCWLDEPVVLAHATAPLIGMTGCHVPGLDAENVCIHADLTLDHGFTARGEVKLARARVGGVLSLAGARLDNPDATALDAGRLTADHHTRMDARFTARGEVRLTGAQISGDLVLTDARLINPGGVALAASQLHVAQSMTADGLRAEGSIHLTGAETGGSLTLTGAGLAQDGD
ncbi:hypothetical protein ABT300_17635 [Streptomyces sp. NPDC001027]|uniref:hypothetical protein n=1 Tax=Streptomyces sp. NPDC001027 TaxID=3154771 RepID=UPI00331CCCCD